MTTTWDSSAKGPHVSLSGADLIATWDGADSPGNVVRTVDSGGASGNYKAEFVVSAGVAGQGVALGVCNAALNPSTGLFYLGTNSISVSTLGGGEVYYNGAPVASIGTASPGDRIAVEFRTADKTVFFRNATAGGDWNGSPTANPATNAGGLAVAGAGPYYFFAASEEVDTTTAVFDAASWGEPASSGFTEINPSGTSYVLTGASPGTGNGAGAIGALRPLAGGLAGAGSQAAALGAGRPIVGSTLGAGSSSAAVEGGPGLVAGTAVGEGTAVGALSRKAPLACDAPGGAAATMDMRGGALWSPTVAASITWSGRSAANGIWSREVVVLGTWS